MLERFHLPLIREIDRQGSLTALAGALQLTQSALSHTIKKLETQLGKTGIAKQFFLGAREADASFDYLHPFVEFARKSNWPGARLAPRDHISNCRANTSRACVTVSCSP
jgi:hypothetical protein